MKANHGKIETMESKAMASAAGPRVLTMAEVAAELRVSPRHVAKLIASGELPRVRYTKLRYVSRQALDQFLAQA